MRNNLARVLDDSLPRGSHLASVENVAREDARMREQIGLSHLDPSEFEFSVAASVADYREALGLVHTAYAEKGYEPKDAWQMRLTAHHLLRDCVVIIARKNGKLAGTISLFGDTAVRLPLDKSYPREVEELRQQGARLAEAGCLAIAPEFRRSGVNALLGLIGQVFARQIFRATHVLMGVNPVAVPFYRAVFNCGVLGGAKEHHELTAPVVALVHETATMSDFLRENFQAPHVSGRAVHEALCDRILDCVKMPETLRRDGFSSWSAASRLRFHLLRLLPQPSVSDRVVIAHALRQPLAAPERPLAVEAERDVA